tara:strand:+ start:657 stop:884 length:228 start_codon:yes stop_codon:yes gene_type:complete
MTSPSLPPLPEWSPTRRAKVRNQVKSRFYYLFWGIATVSVVAGQLYVGAGYRSFANSLNRLFNTIDVEVQQPRFY